MKKQFAFPLTLMLGMIAALACSFGDVVGSNAPSAAPTVALLPTVAPLATVPRLATVPLQPTIATQAQPTTAASGKILFQDDFSDPKSGWQNTKIDCCQFEYVSGAYRLVNGKDNTVGFSLLPSKTFDNISVEVDVMKSSGPASGVYGIGCRVSSAYDKGYIFALRADGAHVIFKVAGAAQKELAAALTSSAVKPGNVTNHLRADCLGNKLALYVNGQKLIEAQDGDYASGQVGMVVSTQPNGGGVDARFDNLIIRSSTP